MYKYIYKLKEELSMGMDRLEKAIEVLEQRIALLEEVLSRWNHPYNDLEHKEGNQ